MNKKLFKQKIYEDLIQDVPIVGERFSKIKLVLIGDEEVGKTSLRKKFTGQRNTPAYIATIGADFVKKDIKIVVQEKNFVIEVLIWDLAGQDTYKFVRESFYEGSAGGLLIVDISRKESFLSAQKWILELWNNNSPIFKPIPIVILANKTDLRAKGLKNVLTSEETLKLIEDMRAWASSRAKFAYHFVETSALDGINVDLAFELLLKEILKIALQEEKMV